MNDLRNMPRGLCRLEVGLEPAGPGIAVAFRLSIGERELARLETSTAELGLPATWLEARDRPAEDYRLPDRVVASLKEHLDPRPSDEPLWLVLGGTRGYLPLVPWERLLHPELKRPLLRLADRSPWRPSTGGPLEIALCFGAPRSEGSPSVEETAERFMERFPRDPWRRVHLHLFADDSTLDRLGRFAKGPAQRITLEFHEIGGKNEPDDANDSPLESPWLTWMTRALAGRSIDIVHFLGHGYLARDQGSLALAEFPSRDDGRGWAPPVHAQQLGRFLDEVGAVAVAFSSPPGNPSIAGLRLLQEQLARTLFGPSLLHDLNAPGAGEGLGAAYDFLISPGEGVGGGLRTAGDFLFRTAAAPAPVSSAITLFHHLGAWLASGRAGMEFFGEEEADPDFSNILKKGMLKDFALTDPVDVARQLDDLEPGWAAGCRRRLERTASLRAFEPANDEEAAIQAGKADALRFVAESLARHAGERGESRGGENSP